MRQRGIESHRFLEMDHRFAELIQPQQLDAKVGVRVGVARVQFESLPIVLDRLGGCSTSGRGLSQKIIRLRVVAEPQQRMAGQTSTLFQLAGPRK